MQQPCLDIRVRVSDMVKARVRARVMVPKKITVSGGAMMPATSSAGTGDYVPLMIDTPAFYTPM